MNCIPAYKRHFEERRMRPTPWTRALTAWPARMRDYTAAELARAGEWEREMVARAERRAAREMAAITP